MFWLVLFVATAIVATGITTDFINWDKLNRDFVSTNELSRAFLASFILIMDLMIVMQVSRIEQTDTVSRPVMALSVVNKGRDNRKIVSQG